MAKNKFLGILGIALVFAVTALPATMVLVGCDTGSAPKEEEPKVIPPGGGGLTWTAVADSTFGNGYNDAIKGIAYGGGKFVAVGDYSKMAYSNQQE
jgi:hypothetical protein